MDHIIKLSIYKSSLYEIDGVFFYIDPTWKNIAISVSGGADSALLTYLLCWLITHHNLKINIHVISNIRMWKTRPWQRYDSLRIFEYIQSKYKNIEFTRHENFIAPDIEYGAIGSSIKDSYGNFKSGDQITVRSHAEYVCVNYKIDAWFSALTMNPIDVTISNGMPDRNIKFSNSQEDLKLLIDTENGIYVCHPFRFTSKDWVVKQYINFDILDLFHKTRSCEGEFDHINYTNYVPGLMIPECGRCFWCQERSWAKNKNNV